MTQFYKDVEYTKINIDQPLDGALNSAYHHESEEDEPDKSDRGKLLASEAKESANGDTPSGPSFWNWQFYQNLFDVDTNIVLRRLVSASIPHPRVNFIRQILRPKSDLYGPFWVSTTLIFVIAIGGNLADYIQHAGQGKWSYDFKKVTISASAIYGYWWFLPALTWLYLKWRGNQVQYGFIDLLALFGYSLTVYIPASILWVIPIGWLQWLVTIIAMLLSSGVIALVFLPIITEVGDRKSGLILMSFIGVLQVAMALGFMLYFFHVPGQENILPDTSQAPLSIVTQMKQNATKEIQKLA